jgi:hypothetical protein
LYQVGRPKGHLGLDFVKVLHYSSAFKQFHEQKIYTEKQNSFQTSETNTTTQKALRETSAQFEKMTNR